MSALTANVSRDRRGPPGHGTFGYPVAAGEKVYAGSLLGITSGGNVQRFQTSGSVAFVGMADRALDNSSGAAASDVKVEALRGTYQITVPSAVPADINKTVYVTTDNDVTLTNTGGTLTACGTLAGIESGKTYVKLLGA